MAYFSTYMFQKLCFILLCVFFFLQSMLLLAPKLSEKTINNQLLKYFAKLQMDQEVLYIGSVCFLLNTSVDMEWFLISFNSGTSSPKFHEYLLFCSHGWFTTELSLFYTCRSFLFVYIHVEERLCSILNNLS